MLSTSINHKLRIAIIGCGAVTERKHLPAIYNSTKVSVNILVDPNENRLSMLAARYNIVNTSTNIDGIEKHADMAIVAVPHHIHAEIAVSLIEKGLHVFIEKPLAVNTPEAKRIIAAAKINDRKVCVGLIRRYYPSFIFTRKVLDLGWIGEIKTFDFREGAIFNWPAVSDTLFRKETGGGVLYDAGAHTLDMLLTWLGNYKEIEYSDDCRGGVEANSLINITLDNGICGTVELSRSRNLRNSCILKGTKGEIEVGVEFNSPVVLRMNGSELRGTPGNGGLSHPTIHDLGRMQIEDFVDAINFKKEVAVSPESTLETIRLFESCRTNQEKMHLPWEKFESEVDFAQFNKSNILILGGTGFIGGRLIESLIQNSTANIKVLVRSYSKMSNISRYPVEVIFGDIKEREILSKATRDCDYVFNCCHGKGSTSEKKQVNIEAPKLLVEEAAKNKVKKVIHISTVSVYGNIADGVISEESVSKVTRREIYGYTKKKGEELALKLSRKLGLSLTVIQPTAVYGPGAPSYITDPIKTLKSNRIILIDGGNGLCNAVYIDDLVNALLLAALSANASFEKLLISGKEPVVTWKEFYGALENMLGFQSTIAMSSQELINFRKHMRKKQSTLSQIKGLINEEFRGNARIVKFPFISRSISLVRSIIPRSVTEVIKSKIMGEKGDYDSQSVVEEKPIISYSRYQEDFFRSKASVNIGKASRLIGYKPKYDFQEGMKKTSLWVKWANLI
jgi:predicted dehydrogenase/nucleoside-diphosphate-sugar epimerase